MKLNLRSISLLTLLFTTGICFSAPLSGIYTIGGSAPSYATFTAAVSALTTNGVSGPVIFNVRPGTYNEQITIPSVGSISAINTVTFQSQSGNRGDVILTYQGTGTNNNWVVNLKGVWYVIFNSITIQATGTTYSNVVYMNTSSSYDTIKNSTLIAPVSTALSTDQVLLNFCADGTNCNYNGAYNDSLYNDSYGVYSNFSYYGGVSYNFALYIENNVLVNQYAYGIYNFRALNCAIRYNTITSNSTSPTYYGIWVGIAFGDTIASNKIINCPGNGIWYDNGEPHIFNNFVELVGSNASYGITFTDMNEDGTTPEISYNSVLVLNTNDSSSAFYIPTGYAQPINYVHDNAFINRGGGYAVNIFETAELTYPNGWSIHSSYDYNDLYTTGTYIGNWGGTDCTTMANWQTTISSCGCGGDSHSVNVNPGFVSNTDLHLTADVLRYGTPDIEINYDIDNQTRNTVTPDIGADEFASPSTAAAFTANNTSVCVGSQVSFTDQSTGSPLTWKWTFKGGSPGSSSSQNPTVTYDTAGTFDVKLVITTSTGADSLIKPGYITVTALPLTGNITSNPDSVCSGGSTLLTVTGSTGNIQWQSSNGLGAYTNITNASSNTYTTATLLQNTNYRVVLNSGTCSDTSKALTVVVNPLPVPPVLSASDSSICPYDSSLITASGTYASYLWNNNGTTGSIYVNSEGPYSVTVGDANGCTAASGQLSIIVFQSPQPPTLSTNDSSICAGDTAIITALGNFSSYNWNTGDTTNYTYATTAGPYRVTVSDVNGCVTVSDNQNIGTFSVPSVSIDVKGDTLISFSSNSFQWYANDTIIPGANSSLYIATQTGNYAVQITDTNGCKTLSTYTNIVVNGINNIAGNILWAAYPVPFNNSIFIKWSDPVLEIKRIEIYDLPGRIVYEQELYNSVANDVEINTTKIPAGIYYLKIETATQDYTQKIIKQ